MRKGSLNKWYKGESCLFIFKFTNVLPKMNKTSDLYNYIFIKRKNNHTSVNHTDVKKHTTYNKNTKIIKTISGTQICKEGTHTTGSSHVLLF